MYCPRQNLSIDPEKGCHAHSNKGRNAWICRPPPTLPYIEIVDRWRFKISLCCV